MMNGIIFDLVFFVSKYYNDTLGYSERILYGLFSGTSKLHFNEKKKLIYVTLIIRIITTHTMLNLIIFLAKCLR